MLLNRTQIKLVKILRKNQNSFFEKSIHIFTDSDNSPNYQKSTRRIIKATQLFVAFSKDSINRGRMEQILLAYYLFKETIAGKIMLYKNMISMVYSPDGDTDFDIVTGVLQWDTMCL